MDFLLKPRLILNQVVPLRQEELDNNYFVFEIKVKVFFDV